MLNEYLPVAMQKIASLIKQEDFIKILSISDDKVELSFTSIKCTVDKWGKVLWT